MNLYPVALNLTGKRCVVVGAGAVGQRKAKALTEAGAVVEIVSRETGGFQPAQLDGAFLVVVATDNPVVNREVAEAARARGVLVNRADDAGQEGDFVTMATVRRGDLLIGITTGGASPTIAAQIKQELSERYGAEWAERLQQLRREREDAKTRKNTLNEILPSPD